jgi:hypothetical protein
MGRILANAFTAITMISPRKFKNAFILRFIKIFNALNLIHIRMKSKNVPKNRNVPLIRALGAF